MASIPLIKPREPIQDKIDEVYVQKLLRPTLACTTVPHKSLLFKQIQ